MEENNVMNEVEVIDNVEVTDLVPSQDNSKDGIGIAEAIVGGFALAGVAATVAVTVKGAKWVGGKAKQIKDNIVAKRAEKKAAKAAAKAVVETEDTAEETPVETPEEGTEE